MLAPEENALVLSYSIFTKPTSSFLEPPPVKRTRTVKPKLRKGIVQKETGLPVVEKVDSTPVQIDSNEDVFMPEKGKFLYELHEHGVLIFIPQKIADPLLEEELEEDYEEDEVQVPEDSAMGVMQLLRQHREDADEADEYYGGEYEEEY